MCCALRSTLVPEQPSPARRRVRMFVGSAPIPGLPPQGGKENAAFRVMDGRQENFSSPLMEGGERRSKRGGRGGGVVHLCACCCHPHPRTLRAEQASMDLPWMCASQRGGGTLRDLTA